AEQRALADAYNRREVAARNAGVEAGKAERQEEIDALRANMEVAINERVATVEAKRQTEARQHFDQNQKLQTEVGTLQLKILKLQQELEQKTSNQKGDMGEVDLFRLLKEAFADDRITRVDKGVEGADVIFAAIDN